MPINLEAIKLATVLLNESCNSITTGPCEDAGCPIWEVLDRKKTCPDFCMDLATLGEIFIRDLNMPRVGDDVILSRDINSAIQSYKKGEKVRVTKLDPKEGYTITGENKFSIASCGFDFWSEIFRNKYTKEIIKTLQEAE
jgi:hypothetical protein